MKLFFLHLKSSLLELLRQPAYLVTTLIFPSMFFWFFGIPNAKDVPSTQLLMGSFSTFAVLGVVVFQFGVGMAADRASSWSQSVRMLPVSNLNFLFSKVAAGLIFAICAVSGVVLTAHLFATPELPTERWFYFVGALVLGGLPFCLIGMTIGYLSTPKAALPVANLVYLPFSFAGGLWIPPNALPEWVANFSKWLPTRFFGEAVWAAVLGHDLDSRNVWGLCLTIVVFAGLATWAYRRDEGVRFG